MKLSKIHFSFNNPFLKMDSLAQKGPESAGNAANCPYLHREASNKKSYGLEVVMKLSKIHFSLNNPFLKMNSLAYVQPISAGNAANCPYLPWKASNEKM